MKYRAYFKLKLTLASPLSIGSSNSENTDRDVVLDSRGKPVIPATATAGVFRERANKDTVKYFGEIDKFKYDEKAKKTVKIADFQKTDLFFYDAQFLAEKAVSVRDSVALNEYKSAKSGAKFDFEIVETGAVFIGYVEAVTEAAADAFENLLTNVLHLGAKNTRGYGSVSVEYQKKDFNSEKTDEWLSFDMFLDSSWENENWKTPDKSEALTTIKLSLKQNGGLSIRQYSTNPGKADSVPLALRDETPVIPGTSWAGMFRSHITKLLDCGKNGLDDIFGFVDEGSKQSAKSKIRFSESQITNALQKQLTRNAIDRFTNGTKDGALFTEVTVYNGTTELQIDLRGKIPGEVQSALAAAILDLHNGYAAVGGLTSIGRGMFKIEKINTAKVSDKNFKDYWNEKDSKWELKNLKEDIFGGE